jgi:hypothetical protein
LRRKCWAARRLCTLLWETLPPPADNENPPGARVPSRGGHWAAAHVRGDLADRGGRPAAEVG